MRDLEAILLRQISNFEFRISNFRTTRPVLADRHQKLGSGQLKTKNSKLKTLKYGLPS